MGMKFIFCLQISMKARYKLILYPKVPKIAMFLEYLKEEVRDEFDFLHGDKHQSFLQVDFSTY